MLKFTKRQWRLFEHLRRKHNVTKKFLQYNFNDIRKFLWHEMRPRIVIRRYAIRKGNRVYLEYYRLRRILYDHNNRKVFERKRQNIKQWSKRMVAYLRRSKGVQEYVVEELLAKNETFNNTEISFAEDITKKLKKQLELLKNGRRPTTLMLTHNDMDYENDDGKNSINNNDGDIDFVYHNNNDGHDDSSCASKCISLPIMASEQTNSWQNSLEITPEKQLTPAPGPEFLIAIQQQHQKQQRQKLVKFCSAIDITEDSRFEEELNNNNFEIQEQQGCTNNTGSFLDVLMSKVVVGGDNNLNNDNGKEILKDTLQTKENSCETLASLDSADGFLGFDETDRVPGMLMTPIVPQSNKNKNENSAFVSEMLNEYMRVNALESSNSHIEQCGVKEKQNYHHHQQKQQLKQSSASLLKKTDLEGLVTPNCTPPVLHMPAVPETLLKLRTVAERKQYLQKFVKNHRLSIINNEAAIYRELQRKLKTCKMKSTSQTLYQSSSSPMSFTRNGWQAASFINTEFYKYYYQMIDIDHGKYSVRLRGVYGNNELLHKKRHVSYVESNFPEVKRKCPDNCLDAKLWHNFKIIKTTTPTSPKKLIKDPLQSILKPCPLLYKPFQKPLDDDTAALLLTGGSMTVVRMPLIELEVFPEHGKPLHEIAKRYLQYILPHHDISREWAEFSVSALQTQNAKCSKESTNISKPLRKSFTFIIPYNNDRDQVLVRRVVDRSEKLDKLFEKTIDMDSHENILKEDFTFRRLLVDIPKVDQTYAIAIDCANVLSDMINTVAISCSENSFIKEDPHGLYHMDMTDSFDDINIQSHIMQRKVSLSVPSPAASSSSSPPPLPLSTSSCGSWPSVGSNKKQNRLLSELKRLNATIIDAAVKRDDETKSCSKEYCALGCVCSSLEGGHPLRDHCGKTKCMLECTCKTAPQSRIMRLETDGRCITTEDAFMLRRKATARLARMEKEFTSTVVLTGNETLLINETNNDKKRRCTKTPKRYEDIREIERDDDQLLLNQRSMPKKIPSKAINNIGNSAIVTTSSNTKNVSETFIQNASATISNNIVQSTDYVAINLEDWEEPIFLQDTIFKQLQHCSVNLVRLEDISNVVPWCMVHELYKCFCKGRSVDGKPFIIEKDESNTTTAHNSNSNNNNNSLIEAVEDDNHGNSSCNSSSFNSITKMPSKRKMKRVDKSEKHANKYDRKGNLINTAGIKQNDLKDDIAKTQVNQIDCKRKAFDINDIDNDNNGNGNNTGLAKRKRISTDDAKLRYYDGKLVGCRRHIPIPRNMYLQKNRLRRREIINKIQGEETPETRLLLNEHIMRSVYYHQAENKDVDDRNKRINASASGISSTVTYKHAQNSTDKQEPMFNIKLNQTAVTTTATATTATCSENVPGHFVEPNTEKLLQMLFNIPQNNFTTPLKGTNDPNQQGLPEVIDLLDDDDITTNSSNNYNDNSFNLDCSMNDYVTADNEDQQQQEDQPSSSSSINDIMGFKELASLCNPDGNTITAGTSSNIINSTAFSLNLMPTSTANATLTATNAAGVSTSIDCTNTNDTAQNQNETISQKIQQPGMPLSAARYTMVALAKELNMSNEDFQLLYQDVIRTMNGMVCKKMYDISETFKRDSITLPQPRQGILCIMRWSNFLAAFMQQCMFMWQVKMKNEHKFLVVTLNNMMPLVVDALGVVNIMALKIEKLPLMARMLLMHFQNEDTQNLGTIMQGKATYWLVKGFIRGDAKHACFKPNPQTRPRLTKKINMLCCLLLRQRVRQEKLKLLKRPNAIPASDTTDTKCNNNVNNVVVGDTFTLIENTNTTASNSNSINNSPVDNILNLPSTSATSKRNGIGLGMATPHYSNDMNAIEIDSYKRKRNLDSSFACINTTATDGVSNQIVTEAKQQINDNCSRTIPVALAAAAATGTTAAEAEVAEIAAIASTTPTKIKQFTTPLGKFKVRSNIEMRKIVQSDVDELHLPETHQYDHKWLVLDLYDDFTHIFVPELKELLSLNRIDKVMTFAKQKHKIIKMQFCSSAPFDVFVTPNSGRKVYVGPLQLNAEQPLLILLQSFNGKMMMREIYQQKYKTNNNNTVNNITKRTTAFWLLSINGQMHLEVDINDSCISGIMIKGLHQQQQQSNNQENTNMYIDSNKIIENSKLNVNCNGNNNKNDTYNDDDDDCVIIENVSPTNDRINVAMMQQQQQSNTNNNTNSNKKQHHEHEQQQDQHINTEKRHNFTIQTVNNNEVLQITAELNTAMPTSSSPEQSIIPVENLITHLPSNVSPHTLQHLTANNTSIKAYNHAQIGTDTITTITTTIIPSAATTILAKPLIPVSIISGLNGNTTLTTTAITSSVASATKTIQSLSSPIIAPTTSASVLITKVVSSLDSLAASLNRSSISSPSSTLSLPSSSTSSLSTSILLNKVQGSGSVATVTNTSTNSNGLPIISSVYSASTTGSMISSMKDPTTTAATESSLQHKIIRRRFSLCPINKVTLVTTTATVTATVTTAATTKLKGIVTASDVESVKSLITTTNCNGPQSKHPVDAVKFLADIAFNLNATTTSNSKIQTMYCTTTAKLTDTTTMLKTNINITTTLAGSTPSSIIMQKQQQSGNNYLRAINETFIRDYKNKQQQKINNSNNVTTLSITRAVTSPALASTSSTTSTMTNNPGNSKLLHQQSIIKTTTKETVKVTAAATTIVCGTSLQDANKQQQQPAQSSSHVLVTNSGNCNTVNPILLAPPPPLILNKKASAVTTLNKSNDNNNVITVRLLNSTNQIKIDNSGKGSNLRSKNTRHNVSNNASQSTSISGTINSLNELKQHTATATTMTPIMTAIQASSQPPPLLLQKHLLQQQQQQKQQQQKQQQLPQLLPLSSVYTFPSNRAINTTNKGNNKDSTVCLEAKIKSNIIIKRCSVGTISTTTISTVTSSAASANLNNVTKPLIVFKQIPSRGQSVSTISTLAETGLLYGKAVTTATITTTTTVGMNSNSMAAAATRVSVIPTAVTVAKPVPFQYYHHQYPQQTATTAVCKTIDVLPKLALITPRGASIITAATTIPTTTIIPPSTVATAKQVSLQQHFQQQHGTTANCSTNNSLPSLTLITPTMITTTTAKVMTQRAPIVGKRSIGNATATATAPASKLLSSGIPIQSAKKLFHSANTNANTNTATATALPSTSAMAEATACTDEVPPLHIQYGYVVASNIDKRFVAKRVKSNYFVKIPTDGIKRFDKMDSVSAYLNNYFETDKDCKGKLPAMWKFLPASQSIQMQNYKKSLVRKIATNGQRGITPNTSNTPNTTNQIGNNTIGNNNTNRVLNAVGRASIINNSGTSDTTSNTSTISTTSGIMTTSATNITSTIINTSNTSIVSTISTINNRSISSTTRNPKLGFTITVNNRRKRTQNNTLNNTNSDNIARHLNVTAKTNPEISETILIDD